MEIAAITKFKHGGLWKAMKQAGMTQSDLARASDTTASTIGCVINLKQKPSSHLASKIQNALAERGVYFDVLESFPDAFKPIKCNTIEQVRDVEFISLEDMPREKLLELPDKKNEISVDKKHILEEVMETLPPQAEKVLRMRFLEQMTTREIMLDLKLSRERVRQIIGKALRRMRHPTRAGRLKKAFAIDV
jgi:RNA polymerase sigma factor (sigma-70 family)